MNIIYNNILALCQARGISGGKMCNDIGLSRNLMTTLKVNDNKKISSDTAQKIADYFGVDVDVVLNGQKENSVKDDGVNFNIQLFADNAKAMEFFALFAQLTPENQATVLAVAKGLLQGQ